MVTEHNTQSFYSAPAVSIVMPVYNNRQYLNECIQSIEQQSFESFELICVDDGSTDGSLELLKQLIKYRENMRLLSQEHAGVSVMPEYATPWAPICSLSMQMMLLTLGSLILWCRGQTPTQRR